jgi:hypothetical protein
MRGRIAAAPKTGVEAGPAPVIKPPTKTIDPENSIVDVPEPSSDR